MLTPVCLEGAGRKHSVEKASVQGTGPAFMGLILALHIPPPRSAVMSRTSSTSHHLWEPLVPGLGLEMAPLPLSLSWLC